MGYPTKELREFSGVQYYIRGGVIDMEMKELGDISSGFALFRLADFDPENALLG